MKKAHYNETTLKLLGWYDDKIHSIIPTPNIEVENSVWAAALEEGANAVSNGELLVVDFRTQAEKDKQQEDAAWNEYLVMENSDKKEKWKQTGKPPFVPTP